ncbi:MAG TPA: DUF177 domain-containing protein [Ilumatobacteraceae bacterium]|nr:DUF177 domain-containing protein [Ilumatobacteraceae bacterium]
MARPLLISASELLRRPGTERDVNTSVTIAELDIDDPRLPADESVEIDLHLDSMPNGIVVDGAIQVPWVGTCRRCLAPTRGTVTSEIHELYQQNPTDPDAFPVDGEQIDLRPLVREAALIDAPATPLCGADCVGLCPTCGIDRNTERCSCQIAPLDDRWSALDQLRGELPE